MNKIKYFGIDMTIKKSGYMVLIKSKISIVFKKIIDYLDTENQMNIIDM